MAIILPSDASIYVHQTTAEEMGISKEEYEIQEALGLVPKIIAVDFGWLKEE